MSTNLLALPLTHVKFEVGNNEDWIDTLAYLVRSDSTPLPQMDLRGINFLLEVRRSAEDYEVILSASTADGSLYVGSPPNVGYLIWYVPLSVMQYIAAADYVGDVVGSDGEFERTVMTLDLTVREGISK